MDIGNLLKDVNSLNEYITITQDASQRCKISKIDLSMSTGHALKKIRSFEIEYFNKVRSEETGIACVIFERLLCWPPANAWKTVSKELVVLLQYWLDAVRKHLVKHNPHWWTFLKLLLKFIKAIGQKHNSIPNMLVEHTSECLLDLATSEKPDAMQKFEILHCFNIFCSESSKELRFTMRNKFLDYLYVISTRKTCTILAPNGTNLKEMADIIAITKLGAYMCACGHLPTQYSIIETLLRWLLPRKDAALRIASATKWFPTRLYSEDVVDIFLTRPWISFLQDARDMLNKHNERGDLITSVVCRKLSVGDIVIIPNSDEVESWLDINSASRSLSVLLGPRALERFGCPYHKSFEMFYVSEHNTQAANLHRESHRLVLSLQTITPPQIMPSCIKLGDDVSCHVTVVLTSQCDPNRLDNALRKIFEDKYQMLLDLERAISPPAAVDDIPPIITEEQKKTIQSMLNNLRKQLSQPQGNETEDLKDNNVTEEQAGPSHPAPSEKVADSGYKTVRLRQPLSCASPSTASTSSLAQLHEKLAALPRHKFDKETPWTCAAPDLSVVPEISEPDDLSTSTIEYRAYGVRSRKRNLLDCSRISQSDNETSRRNPGTVRKGTRTLSPVVQCNTTNSLLATTLESANDSVINDTAENIPITKDIDTVNVDLLYQEAMQASQEKSKDKIDSGINTQEKRCLDINKNCQPKKKSKVIFSTSDESNTEAISDTPNVYVTNRRRKKVAPKAVSKEKKSFDVHMVEDFFSQHFTKHKETGDIVISPKLARKFNETSSEASDDLQDVEPYDFNNFEVLECLNNIVDKVCEDFDKCTQYLNNEQSVVGDDNNSDIEDDMPLQDYVNKIQNCDTKNIKAKKTATKTIKLKYKIAPKKDKMKSRATNQKDKLEIESASKLSSIIEESVVVVEKTNIPEILNENVEKSKKESLPEDTNASTTPMLRRKRKLFSPKDEHMPEKAPVVTQPEENLLTDDKIKKTPKSTGTYKPYKELEKERKRVRTSRNRKSKIVEVESPRTKKMNDLFDKVKGSANGEQVTLANKADLEVYNFSTDSEDDFKEKKIDISKKTTTLESVDSTVLRHGKVIKRTNYSNVNNDKTAKRKVNQRQNKKKKINMEPERDLVDERMREAKETLDTSIVVEKPTKLAMPEPDLILRKPPEMEIIQEKEVKTYETRQKVQKHRKRKGKTCESNKEPKKILNVKPSIDTNRTESPLPGLLVEKAPPTKMEDGDLSSNMADKFKKICQNPEKYINESNTTQNLLSDNERNMYSPQTIEMTEDFMEVEVEDSIKKKNPKGKITKNKRANSVKIKKPETKLQQANESVVVINACGSEVKSDQSIATAGITGHGDSEEAPPSPNLIAERLEHRNLETEYFDNSAKDYFDKLTEEINDINEICRKDSKDNDESCDSSKTDEAKILDNNIKNIGSPKFVKSPVVSIERISLEDISRWLPSRRNSESDYNSPSSSKSKQKSKDLKRKSESPEIIETKQVSSSDDEPDIQEAIRRSLRLEHKMSPVFKINNSGTRNKSQIVRYDSEETLKNTCSSVKAKETETLNRVSPPRKVMNIQKSLISPIKLFDDLATNADNLSAKLSQSTLSDDEEYMNEIKQTLYKQLQNPKISEKESIKETTRIKKNKKDILNRTVQKDITARSIDSGSRYDTRKLKRSMKEDAYYRKKQKVEDGNNIVDVISESAATVTSVDDWFRRSEPGSGSAEQLNIMTRDSIQTVIEKLDTTLVEIHQNTSNKFVHLFVSAQQQLRELKVARQNLYKQVAADILAGVVQLMDENFADLDKRSQEQDANFMKQLKEQASAVIREDVKQKRVMVQLLKEDVLAVVEHVAKTNK